MLLAVTTILFLCYHINAEARTTQQRAALRRLRLTLYVMKANMSASFDIFQSLTTEI